MPDAVPLLAGPLSELDEDSLSALIDDLEVSLAPFTDDNGVAFPMGTYFVKAFS
ncbi:MAG: hypothetical protein ACOCVV_04300 [Marinobacter sp.]